MILTIHSKKAHPTKGDIIKSIFPDSKIRTNILPENHVYVEDNNKLMRFDPTWWNSPYEVPKGDKK